MSPEIASEKEKTIAEMALRVRGVGSNLAAVLEASGLDGRALSLTLPQTGITVGPEVFIRLRERLLPLPDDLPVRSKLGKIWDRMPPGMNPGQIVTQFVTGQLIDASGGKIPRGGQIKPDTAWLMKHLEETARRLRTATTSSRESEQETEEKQRLLDNLPSQLDALAAECATYDGDLRSAFGQLMDPLCSAGRGLFISTTTEEMLFSPIQSVLETLAALRHEEAAIILNTWILQRVSGKEEDLGNCIASLGILAQTTLLLDEASLIQLYGHPNSNGSIPYLPFRSLYQGVGEATRQLSQTKGAESFIQPLRGVQNILLVRYSQIIRTLPEIQSGVVPPPEVGNLASFFFDRYEKCRDDHSLPFNEAAYYIVQYLEQLAVNEPYVLDLCKQISWVNEPLAGAITQEATIMGLLKDEGGRTERELVNELRKNPWVDAAEINLSEMVPQDTDKLIIFVFTGTFGPAHKGHIDCLQKIIQFMRYQDEVDAQQGIRGVRRILLILPITKPGEIKGWGKDAAQAGPVEIRVASLLAQLPPDLDRTKVLITTTLQPEPQPARTLEGRVNATVSNLMAAINKNLADHDRLATFSRQIIMCAGVDELQFTSRGGGRLILAENQSTKFRVFEDWLLVGRHRFLIAMIQNCQRFINMMGIRPAMVLTPGLSVSSREAIINIASGRGTDLRLPGRPLVTEWWSPHAIQDRQRHVISEKRVPSVSRIYQYMMVKLEGKPKKEGKA